MMSEKDIRDQVDRICLNEDFSSKILLCKFLRFVVDETLAGRGDELKGYIIGIEVFGKDKHFDPEQDSLVRIHAGRLRRLLKMYYLEAGEKDPILIEIPKGSYQAQFIEKSGFEIANTSDEDFGKHNSDQPINEATVAVLPFKNLSGDPNTDYFAYGLSEEVSNALNQYEDLTIINCWIRPKFKKNNINEIYSDIGARFLLDGCIQEYHNQIIILVKLLDTRSGEQIWSDRYKRDSTIENIINIEEEISDTITRTIGSETGVLLNYLSKELNHAKLDKLSVFEATLRFYYYEAHLSPQLGAETLASLLNALNDDPKSGIIHAMIAGILGTAYALDFPNSSEYFDKMGRLAETALKLEPENQIVKIVYMYKCFLYNEKNRFFQEAENCLSMKISSPFRLGTIGHFLALYGDWERGKSIMDKAMIKNVGFPLHLYGGVCAYYYRKDDFISALSAAKKFNMPGIFWGSLYRLACYGQLNRKDQIKSHIKELKNLKPDFEEKAPHLISRYIKEEDLVIKLMDGLRKAGLKISLKPVPS